MSAVLKNPLLRAAILFVGALFLVIVVNVAANGAFLRPYNIVQVLQQITYSCVLAVGQTFVIITAGIDLSIGSLVGLTGVVMAKSANAMGFDGFGLVIVTLLIGLAVGALAGWINALPVVKLNLPPFITTFAMLEVAYGLAFIVSGGPPIPLHSHAFSGIGSGSLFGVIPIRRCCGWSWWWP